MKELMPLRRTPWSGASRSDRDDQLGERPPKALSGGQNPATGLADHQFARDRRSDQLQPALVDVHDTMRRAAARPPNQAIRRRRPSPRSVRGPAIHPLPSTADSARLASSMAGAREDFPGGIICAASGTAPATSACLRLRGAPAEYRIHQIEQRVVRDRLGQTGDCPFGDRQRARCVVRQRSEDDRGRAPSSCPIGATAHARR